MPDPNVQVVDAFTITWEVVIAYAFPSLILLNRVQKRMRLYCNSNCPSVAQTGLVSHAIGDADSTPSATSRVQQSSVLENQGRVVHPDPESLSLVAWKLSRDEKFH